MKIELAPEAVADLVPETEQIRRAGGATLGQRALTTFRFWRRSVSPVDLLPKLRPLPISVETTVKRVVTSRAA